MIGFAIGFMLGVNAGLIAAFVLAVQQGQHMRQEIAAHRTKGPNTGLETLLHEMRTSGRGHLKRPSARLADGVSPQETRTPMQAAQTHQGEQKC